MPTYLCFISWDNDIVVAAILFDDCFSSFFSLRNSCTVTFLLCNGKHQQK